MQQQARFKSVNRKVAEGKMFIEGSRFSESGEKQRAYFHAFCFISVKYILAVALKINQSNISCNENQ
jgi:hypothetical protein